MTRPTDPAGPGPWALPGVGSAERSCRYSAVDDERKPVMISLHPHRHQAAPPEGPGRWSADGQHWFDEAGERWLPVVEGQDTLCIQLEDVPAASLREAVAARLPHHPAPSSRFVGHATSVDPRWPAYEIAGDPFPRCRPSSEVSEHRETWPTEMAEALTGLCSRLEAAGWSRVGCGGHPWAWRYSRRRVGWPSDDTVSAAPTGC